MVGASAGDRRHALSHRVAKTLAELAADGSMDPGWAAALEPVADRIADMGARAVLRLADVMGGRNSGPISELHSPELVVRGTTLRT